MIYDQQSDDIPQTKITGAPVAQAAVPCEASLWDGGDLQPAILFCDFFTEDGEESLKESE